MNDNLLKKIKLPNDVLMIIKTLNVKGFKCYAVGGCIRDSILGKYPKDWDLTTNAKVRDILEIFKNFKKINKNGEKHGTVTININDKNYEITTYRMDGRYTDCRHPDSVEFTSDIKEDLKRRDFTINALAFDGKELIDYFFGINDLKNKSITSVGDPNKRFNEDALRILRALRFSAKLNFTIDNKTKESIHKNISLLKNISKERIQSELNEILLYEKDPEFFIEFHDVFEFIIPDLKPCFDFNENNKHQSYNIFKHTMTIVTNSKKDLSLKLSALLLDIEKPKTFPDNNTEISLEMSKSILKDLKYSNKIITEVCTLIMLHNENIYETKKWVIKMLSKCKTVDMFEKFINLKVAINDCNINVDNINAILNDVLNEKSCFSIKNLAVNGNDMLELGMTGKEIGDALKLALLKVVSGDIKNTKKEILSLIKSEKL